MAFTFFFRDTNVLDLLVRTWLPTVTGRSRIRIWDAGCAMGQEPFTLVIYLAEVMNHFAFQNVTVMATDLGNDGLSEKAMRSAVYSCAELQRVPQDILDKHFEPDAPGMCRVAEPIRHRINYLQHDLLSLREPAGGFSLVLCKNVLLHFSPSQRVEVIRMFHRALDDGGFLAMENTQKMPVELAPLFRQITPEVQVFQKETARPA